VEESASSFCISLPEGWLLIIQNVFVLCWWGRSVGVQSWLSLVTPFSSLFDLKSIYDYSRLLNWIRTELALTWTDLN